MAPPPRINRPIFASAPARVGHVKPLPLAPPSRTFALSSEGQRFPAHQLREAIGRSFRSGLSICRLRKSHFTDPVAVVIASCDRDSGAIGREGFDVPGVVGRYLHARPAIIRLGRVGHERLDQHRRRRSDRWPLRSHGYLYDQGGVGSAPKNEHGNCRKDHDDARTSPPRSPGHWFFPRNIDTTVGANSSVSSTVQSGFPAT